MSSEITSDMAEWLMCKNAIGSKIDEIVNFSQTKLKECKPYLARIHEKQLWKLGRYSSFKEFCETVVGVTRQRVYQLLKEDKMASGALEISEGEATNKFDTSTATDAQQKPAPTAARKARAEQAKAEPAIEVETSVTPQPEPQTPADPILEEPQPIQTELNFTVEIIAQDDDRRWFQNLTPAERGEIISQARKEAENTR